MWSENPTEDQILQVFHTTYTFKIMRCLMQKPMTVAEIYESINATNYERIYPAIKHLQKYGLIKIKEYKTTQAFNKTAVFVPTVKNISVRINSETYISTDTKLILHGDFENGEE